MSRDEVVAYFAIISDEYSAGVGAEMPDKFKMLDEDSDGYISFDELLKTVDLYFDYQLELDIEEVRELNDFFFSQ
jgi:Ca2+-binding EF-hand superfamily protein